MSKLNKAISVIGTVAVALPLALATGALYAAEQAAPPAPGPTAAPGTALAPATSPNALTPGPTIVPGFVPGEPTHAPGAPIPPGPAGSPDWPCVQRKVLTLTSVQIWDGPPVEDLKGWEEDFKIGELTGYLESRRVPLEDAEKAIKEFAQSQPEAERDQKLGQLFAAVLDKTNRDRKFVIGRIEEFQRRQKARAQALEREGQKLAKLNQAVPADHTVAQTDAKLTPEQEAYAWNARVFQERQGNLTMACEIPALIEQRVYEIGKLIRAQMKS